MNSFYETASSTAPLTAWLIPKQSTLLDRQRRPTYRRRQARDSSRPRPQHVESHPLPPTPATTAAAVRLVRLGRAKKDAVNERSAVAAHLHARVGIKGGSSAKPCLGRQPAARTRLLLTYSPDEPSNCQYSATYDKQDRYQPQRVTASSRRATQIARDENDNSDAHENKPADNHRERLRSRSRFVGCHNVPLHCELRQFL